MSPVRRVPQIRRYVVARNHLTEHGPIMRRFYTGCKEAPWSANEEDALQFEFDWMAAEQKLSLDPPQCNLCSFSVEEIIRSV